MSRAASSISMDKDLEKEVVPDQSASNIDPDDSPQLEQTETGKHREAVQASSDWDGPNDVDNPVNWSWSKKTYHTVIPAIYGFTVTFASSVYTPGIASVMKRFHVSSTVALLGLSLYVLGLGFGPMIAAPLSERYGRRVVYWTSLPIFGFFTLGAGFSQSIVALCVCRFFAGFFGGPPLSVGAGTNADMWSAQSRATATSLFVLAPFLGPALGPVVGGFSVDRFDFRWTQWTSLFFMVVAFVFSFRMKETYKKVILQRRVKKRGLLPPKQQGPQGLAAIKFILMITLFRPVHMLCTEPIVTFLSLYIGFNFAVLFAFFAAFPVVFGSVYHFNKGETGLVFLGIGIGCVLAVITCLLTDRLTYQKHYRKSLKDTRGGKVRPEHRLYPAMMGSLGLPIGLFWFAWTAKQDIHWISPVLATIPFAWGNLCIFTAAVLYLVDTYQALSGASAVAANGLVRYLLGAAFPLFTIQMYHRLGIAWATSLLGFIAVALMPVPWVFFKWGPYFRSKSGYDTIKI